jgi:hypothetical protein
MATGSPQGTLRPWEWWKGNQPRIGASGLLRDRTPQPGIPQRILAAAGSADPPGTSAALRPWAISSDALGGPRATEGRPCSALPLAALEPRAAAEAAEAHGGDRAELVAGLRALAHAVGQLERDVLGALR